MGRWELVKDGALILEGPVASVEGASVRVSVLHAATIDSDLVAVADR